MNLLTMPIPNNYPFQTISLNLPPQTQLSLIPHPSLFSRNSKKKNHDKPLPPILSKQNHQLRPRRASRPGGFLRPPISTPPPPPVTIHLRLCSDRNILTKTKPIVTYPEPMVNLTSFYVEGLQGDWHAISPRSMRGILLSPEEVSPLYANLRMASADNPFYLLPAHIPSLSDVEQISKPLAAVLRWWIKQMDKEYSLMTVPWELQFLLDPVPVLPVVRKALSISDEWLVLQSLSGTNNVKLMHLVQEAQQLQLSVGWGKKKGENTEMSGIRIQKNTVLVYNNYQGKYVELNNNAAYPSRKEMSKLPIMNPGMNVLLWNARGIARDGFKRNIHWLIKDHEPDIIILTETKVPKLGCEELLSLLPYNSFEVVDPVGYSGGILILWNSGFHSITMVSKEPRAIHTVVQAATTGTK